MTKGKCHSIGTKHKKNVGFFSCDVFVPDTCEGKRQKKSIYVVHLHLCAEKKKKISRR